MSQTPMPNEHNLAHKITTFALQRPVTIFVIFLSLLVIGSIASSRLEKELIPSGMDEGIIEVRLSWRDAPAKEVLDNVTLPLEQELSSIKGISRLVSRTWLGGTRVRINFKQGIDLDIAYREIRDRIERARIVFPDDVGPPRIRKVDTSGIPIVVLGIVIDDGINDYVDLIEKKVVNALERLEGVADVSMSGIPRKEIVIDVNRQALESAGLNALRVSRALAADNFTLTSGHAFEGGKKYFLRSISQYTTLEDIENRLIAKNVRLKDVATVAYKESERRWDFAVNSKRALSVGIIKEGNANTVEVSNKIAALVEQFQQDPELQYVDIKSIFSQGDQITFAINNLSDSGIYGAFLAFGVLFLFLFKARLTAIITLAIPISLLVALTAMYFLGHTLNILSLVALVICVGLLVDNAVVVAENIYRLYFEDNITRAQACIRGSGEIAFAVLTSTLTTIIVFLPISLVQGRAQYALQQVSIPITFSLIGSFLIAIVFVPLCVFLTLSRKQTNNKMIHRYDQAINVSTKFHHNIFDPISRAYVSTLAFFLRHRLDLFILFVAVQAIIIVAAKDRIEFSPGLGNKDNQLMIRFHAPQGTNYADVKAYFDEIEDTLEQHGKELKIKDYMVVSWRSGGKVEAWFDKSDMEDIDVQTVAAELVKRIPEKAGYRLRYGQENESDEQARKNKQLVLIQGENPDLLDEVAQNLIKRILAIDGVIGLQGNSDETPNELALIIDREKIASAGVESDDVAGVVSSALRGRSLSTMNYANKVVDMRIRFQEEDRALLSDISTFNVKTAGDEDLPIGALTQAEFVKSSAYIYRRNKKMSYRMTFELDPEKSKEARRAIAVLQNAMDLPEGVSFNRQVGINDNADLKQMKFATILSIIFIYLLMGFLFESAILPLSILLTIPLAFVGVCIGHVITGLPIDFLSLVALVLLVGVVVNNGIVLVDTIQKLRREGVSRDNALLTAVQRRFRPITMTALTTIVGLIPLTFSPAGAMDIGYKSFGTTLISGMTLATLLTLLVIPVFYSIFDDIQQASILFIERLGFKRNKP